MTIDEMEITDAESVILLYIEYYNNHEGSCWTQDTAGKRIRQVLSMDDAYALVMKDDQGSPIGFVMRYLNSMMILQGIH